MKSKIKKDGKIDPKCWIKIYDGRSNGHAKMSMAFDIINSFVDKLQEKWITVSIDKEGGEHFILEVSESEYKKIRFTCVDLAYNIHFTPLERRINYEFEDKSSIFIYLDINLIKVL